MTTRIHHLSCATMRPGAGRIPGMMPRELVAHVLVIEGEDGLTLVDTGFGTADVEQGAKRLGRPFVTLVGAKFNMADTAQHQVRSLGYDTSDVRNIVLTHMDLDHAGGISDFPEAAIHLHTAEHAAATNPTMRERQRYLKAHWAHGPKWVTHDTGGDDWFGFASARAVGEDVALIPLFGHTRGHSGVIVRRPGGGFYLHAGDAYFSTGDKQTPRKCPPGLRAFQQAMQMDHAARVANLARLQQLHAEHSNEVTVFCAHDKTELDGLRSVTD